MNITKSANPCLACRPDIWTIATGPPIWLASSFPFTILPRKATVNPVMYIVFCTLMPMDSMGPYATGSDSIPACTPITP